MKKIIFIYLVSIFSISSFGQNNDIIILDCENEYEVVDGFIFKAINVVEISTNEKDSPSRNGYPSYLLLLFTSDNYFFAGAEYSKELDVFEVSCNKLLPVYSVKKNNFSPNEFKMKGKGVEWTMYFSKNKFEQVNEFGDNRDAYIEGKLVPLNQINVRAN